MFVRFAGSQTGHKRPVLRPRISEKFDFEGELAIVIGKPARLLPGDVIATGTPGGVGAARIPPRWLKVGDSIEVDIPGVGLLVNPVADE